MNNSTCTKHESYTTVLKGNGKPRDLQSFPTRRSSDLHPGENVGMGKDHTLFALKAGKVSFCVKANDRSYVSVIPMAEAAE